MAVSAGAQEKGVIETPPDTLSMEQVPELLEAASISAVGNPIVVKQDTIEFNTNVYLMTEDDLLEDLLKKLPGVEIDENGAVLVNGERVTRVMIDGKRFFLNDPKLASRNILAKYVKKLKVIEKKSDQAEFSGIDDGERETVIDLSLSDEMGKGVHGNFLAGAGHDLPGPSGALSDETRLQGSAFLSQFRKDRQLSLVANANNTNNRASAAPASQSSSEPTGGGVLTTYMLGANAAFRLLDDRMDASANYVFNHGDNDLRHHTERQTFLAKRTLDYTSDELQAAKETENRVGARIEHQFSPASSLIYEQHFSHSLETTDNQSEFSTFSRTAADERQTNEGSRFSSSRGRTLSTNGSLQYRQRLGIPGRTLIALARYSFSGTGTDGANRSLTRTFRTDGSVRDSLIDQTSRRESHRSSLSGRLTYTEPVGGGFYLEGNYTYSWAKSTSFKNAYDRSGTFDPRYSNDINNLTHSHRVGVNLKFQHGKTRAQVGVALVPTHTENYTTKRGISNAIKTDVLNWAPQFSFSFDPKQNASFRATYFGNSSQPAPARLMPVPDITNPLHVTMGNPYLLPSFNNAFNLRYRMSDKKRFSSVNLRIGANITDHPVVNALWYDVNGVQYSMPVNGPIHWDANFNFTFNAPIARSPFSVYGMTSGSYATRSSYVGAARMDLDAYYAGGEFDYQRFHEDYRDIASSDAFTANRTQTVTASQRLRLSYRNKNLELQCGGRTRVNRSWYTIKEDVAPVWNHSVNASFNYKWTSIGLSCDAQASYNWYRGYTSPVDDEVLVNLRVSKSLFKKRMTLSLQGFDLLAQAKSLRVTDQSNQHREVLSNTLGRYVMVTASWRMGKTQGARNKNVKK